jgi:DNA-binding response OmpR family regulator
MALILILDADEVSAAALAAALTARGHRVRNCARPHHALRLNRLLAFDLLWMAWPLLDMEADAFLRRLRRLRPDLTVAIACREEMGEALSAPLRAHSAKLLRASKRLPLLVMAAEACLPPPV